MRINAEFFDQTSDHDPLLARFAIPLNDAPIAVDDSAITDEDTAVTIAVLANDSDPDHETLTVTAINGQAFDAGGHATLVSGIVTRNADQTLTFTPNADFNGPVSFDYTVSDGTVSDTGTVNLAVNPVNDAPVFTSSASFTVAENHTAVGTVTAVDPEHNAFTFALAGGADQSLFSIDAHTGALAFVSAPDFETKQDANHDGIYDLVVWATDALAASRSQTVHVTVTDLTESGQIFNGGNGNDNLAGTTGSDTMNGGNGNDHLDGRDGNDLMSGGNGNDELIGGRGNDTLDGGNGDDDLDGGLGDDHLEGGNGNDSLTAGDGNDSLSGGDGNDMLNAGEGDNLLDGGKGNDVLTAGMGNDNLSGGDGNDTLNAGAGNNLLDGGKGNDTLTAGVGNDNLSGGDGNDILSGGGGNDFLMSGKGNDILVFAAGFGQDAVSDFGPNDIIEFTAACSRTSRPCRPPAIRSATTRSSPSMPRTRSSCRA